MTETVAPVFCFASATVPKIGMPSKSSPAFFGFTPATKQFLPLAYSRHMRVWNWPVFPVMPCVRTLVLRSMRMDIGRSGDWAPAHYCRSSGRGGTLRGDGLRLAGGG